MRGIVAGAGGMYRLPQQIPYAVALEMLALGEPIDAQRAYALGLVNAVVADDQVLDTALDLARRICTNAPLSVRESLKIARAAHERRETELIAMTNDAIGRLVTSDDFSEGPRAFVEKRPPRWTGA